MKRYYEIGIGGNMRRQRKSFKQPAFQTGFGRRKAKWAKGARASYRARWRAGTSATRGYFGRFSGANAEMKFFDLTIDDAVIGTGANIVQDSCNKIPQGVTESTRIGRKCTVKAINWRFTMTLDSNANFANGQDVVRVILYLDKQCNGATAVNTQILESSNVHSFNNLANKSRFRTLMDRTYDLYKFGGAPSGAAYATGEYGVTDSLYKKCNIPIEFDNTTGAITEIRSNNIGVMLCTFTGIASFTSKMRLRFSDS